MRKTQGYKILTYDYRPPLQGGEPIWDGKTLPFELPPVQRNNGRQECAEGWNFTRELRTAFSIAGLWPSGYPSVALLVESNDAIQRGLKLRCSILTLLRQCTEEEIRRGITELSAPFGDCQQVMVESQLAWRAALARPLWNTAQVEASLHVALQARGLSWKLKQYPDDRNIIDAFFNNARDALPTWDYSAAQHASDSWDARDGRFTKHAGGAWEAGRAWRGSWSVTDALTLEAAVLCGWLDGYRADYLTVGIRDAYRYGLDIALPTESRTLGYAMVTVPTRDE